MIYPSIDGQSQMPGAVLEYVLWQPVFNIFFIPQGVPPMSAESMMFNGFIIAITTVLFGLAWGFVILKIQNGAGKAE